MQVFSNAIPTIPTIPRYFETSVPYHPGSIRYFQMSYLRYQRYHGVLRSRYLPYRLDQIFSGVIPAIPTIPRYFEILVPTIPARSGIFRCHTHDTHAYPGMEYPGYIPGVCRVRYLTHGFCGKFETFETFLAHHFENEGAPISLQTFPLGIIACNSKHTATLHRAAFGARRGSSTRVRLIRNVAGDPLGHARGQEVPLSLIHI